jgi:hypothetical protein
MHCRDIITLHRIARRFGLAKPLGHKKITSGNYNISAVHAANACPVSFLQATIEILLFGE